MLLYIINHKNRIKENLKKLLYHNLKLINYNLIHLKILLKILTYQFQMFFQSKINKIYII